MRRRAPKKHATSAMRVRRAKTNMIIDFFGPALPNAVRSPATVVRASSPSSCPSALGGSCALPNPARVLSARLRPRLRHGRGRYRFAKRPHSSLRTSTATQLLFRTRRYILPGEDLCGLVALVAQIPSRGPFAKLRHGAAVVCHVCAKDKKAKDSLRRKTATTSCGGLIEI